ncbi:alpha,alpha-trehalose-phosphate synthase [UDP-forming] 1-like [Humulus lupulus]|uniref:alpha,alpha-trehalose-phosphate synthase [UDP-forming] 1-like n=1 Tax=Humulus lupulus TaxID=3486 RepID=UPI002B40EBF8|nr:alpha,alpha-trehalose-phosphate synthase [UDP-forming] 1-like [Humulus lupulus]
MKVEYHLMYLPKCLKDFKKSMKVGWFLHTPFPSYEIHKTLPSRSELLYSVLAADLVANCPIDIDSDRFIRALELPQVQEHIREHKERFAGRKVKLGVDRLDMIKGIPQKILAFKKFLEENPDRRDKVVFLQIVVPTRTDVPECILLSKFALLLLVFA